MTKDATQPDFSASHNEWLAYAAGWAVGSVQLEWADKIRAIPLVEDELSFEYARKTLWDIPAACPIWVDHGMTRTPSGLEPKGHWSDLAEAINATVEALRWSAEVRGVIFSDRREGSQDFI